MVELSARLEVPRRVRALALVLALAAVAALVVAVAFQPGLTLAAAAALAAGAGLLRSHGLILGTWFLALFLIPLREPLGFDVQGTLTVYPGDLPILAALAAVVWRDGLASLWRDSLVLKVAAVLLVASAIGFITSPAPSWEVAHIYRLVFQIAVFVIARRCVLRAKDATGSLVALLAGMTIAAGVGFWQSALPVGDNGWPLAYDVDGVPHSRVPGSFDHPLHFSMALSIAAGVGIGLALIPIQRSLRLLALVAAAVTAVANQYTYSVSALLGTGAAALTALAVRNWRLAAVFPLVAVAWLAVAPEALLVRISGHVTGESSSGLARILTYQQGINAYLDHPVFGVGWGGISRLSSDEYRLSRATAVASAPENYFLYRVVALGIAGIVCYPLLLGLFLRNIRARPPDDGTGPWPRAAIAAGGIAFYVQAMLVPAGWPSVNFILWMFFAMAETQRELARGAAADS